MLGRCPRPQSSADGTNGIDASNALLESESEAENASSERECLVVRKTMRMGVEVASLPFQDLALSIEKSQDRSTEPNVTVFFFLLGFWCLMLWFWESIF